MSGFVCLLQTDGSPLDRALLRSMTEAMAFRGPDAQHTWQDGPVGLGHALLRTTIECGRERQPLSFDGDVWISADARLDGRSDLIAELRAGRREVVADAPDAALVLHAYHLWGENCLSHLIGDFAFAIWDARERRLFCGHDHFGVVPFYYAECAGALIVSNTLPCVRLHPAVSNALNDQAIGDVLLFGMNYDAATTTFRDIRRLAPAEKLTWSRHAGLRVERYWSMAPVGDEPRYRRGEDYLERFRDLFRQAVADRLRTDSLGTHLSGGLDSSSVAVTAHDVLRDAGSPFDLRAYTIVYEHLIPDEEGRYATTVAEWAGMPIELLVAEEFLTRAPAEQPTHVASEPLQLPGMVAEIELAQRVASFARVLLAGFGGDPLLYYDDSYLARFARRGRFGAFAAGIARHAAVHRRPPPLRLGLRTALRRRFSPSSATPRYGVSVPDWIDPDFAARCALDERIETVLDPGRDRGQQGMASQPLWSNVFAWADAGFTGLPLKLRFPFFDLRLVRYMQCVPAPWLYDKTLLRRALRGALPESVLARPKTPLAGNARWNHFRRRGLPAWAMDLLTAPGLAPYVVPARLRSRLAPAGEISEPQFREIERALPLAYWLRVMPLNEL